MARLIAGALREAGYRVMAKTTGSKSVLIFPDGTEKDIARRGLPTILEGKRAFKEAARLKASAMVAELMSIQPECLRVESRKIIQPRVLIITNVRLDHQDEMGRTKAEIARSLAASIAPGSTVFIPEEEIAPEFEREAREAGASIIPVKKHFPIGTMSQVGILAGVGFEENVRLSLAVAEFLGVDQQTALRGMEKARPDFGSLKIWEASLGEPPRRWLLVSAFAANDPESTREVLGKLEGSLPRKERALVGLLNFRLDRAERTQQWLEAIEQGFFEGFDRMVFVGAHLHSLRVGRIIKALQDKAAALAETSPEGIMEGIAGMEKRDAVLIGMGNIGGLGVKLVNLWETIGKPYHA